MSQPCHGSIDVRPFRWAVLTTLQLPTLLMLAVAATGCGGSSAGPAEASRHAAQAKPAVPTASGGQTQKPPVHRRPAVRIAADEPGPITESPPAQPGGQSPGGTPGESVAPPSRLAIASQSLAERALAAGFRRLEGEHLVLFTDRPSDPEIDILPQVFDQAYSQWCAYFSRPQQLGKAWRMHAFLMGERSRFRAAGTLPADLPQFDHGYCAGMDLWLDEQPNAYYRRHLLLHEGTHGFMHTVLGSVGPVWYAEGMAELLATHRWADGRLTLDWFPRSRDEVPLLGRIKLVRDAVAAGHARSVAEILATDPVNRFGNQTYAWCWALASLLDRDARYRPRFRQSQADVLRSDFNALLERRFAADWGQLNDQWDVFAATLDHGYDFQRAAIEFAKGEPLPPAGAKLMLRADRGWQSARLTLDAGHRYRVRASGRFQVADKPRTWWCEPGGVSIRYIAGHPLGVLLAAVRPDRRDSRQPTPLVRPQVVGLSASIEPTETGTLYLRINDSPAELSDNAGQLEVEVQ
jgi:hypothetical protein